MIVKKEIRDLPVREFHRFNDPHSLDLERVVYRFFVHVKDVPEGIPMDPNPREQKTSTAVASDIRRSLVDPDDKTFYLKNRGILLTADSVTYDNKTKTVNISMIQGSKNGNVDGGHTYKVILEEQDKGTYLEQYVNIEVAVGCEKIADLLAEARNTSAQVDDKSMAELQGKLDPIKELIGETIFSHRVAYKQNQHDKAAFNAIDVRDVIAVLQMFNQKTYPSFANSDKHPTICYTSKVSALKAYTREYDESISDGSVNEFVYMKNVARDIFELYNHIERNLPQKYNDQKGSYGSKKYSQYNKDIEVIGYAYYGSGKIKDDALKYIVPKGLILPLIASFRGLIYKDDNGYYMWKNNVHPINVFEEIGDQLCKKAVSMCATMSNSPDAFAKDTNSWDLLYKQVVISTL